MRANEETSKSNSTRETGIPVPTPVFYLAGLLAGICIELIKPISVTPTPWYYLIGALFIIPSFLIMPPILKRFKNAGTPFKVREAATALITDGPYRYSRNPGYVSLTMLYIG